MPPIVEPSNCSFTYKATARRRRDVGHESATASACLPSLAADSKMHVGYGSTGYNGFTARTCKLRIVLSPEMYQPSLWPLKAVIRVLPRELHRSRAEEYSGLKDSMRVSLIRDSSD